MDKLLKDIVGGDDDAVGEEGLLDGGGVDGPGAGSEAEGKRHYVPFNVQGYLSRFFVHQACVTTQLRSMTCGSMSFGRSMHLRSGSFSGKLRKRHSRAQEQQSSGSRVILETLNCYMHR